MEHAVAVNGVEDYQLVAIAMVEALHLRRLIDEEEIGVLNIQLTIAVVVIVKIDRCNTRKTGFWKRKTLKVCIRVQF